MNKILTREECRKIMVDILTEIDRVCQENGIPYYLGGGTLLGAVRHQGFIPWDDDIDIFLSREDYNRLLVLLKNCKMPSWFEIINENTPGYYLPFAKATDNRTIVKKKASIIQHGIWVDIFPMEDVPDNSQDRSLFLKRCQFLRGIIISMVTDFSTQKLSIKTMQKYLLGILAKCYGRKRFLQLSERYMQKYNSYKTKTMCITWSPYGTEYMEKELMKEVIDLDFEGKKFKGPKAYDLLLTRAFGNYMELPPIEKRKNHEVVAWWKD